MSLILYQTAVGGHIGEEYQGQTTREQTRATTKPEHLVAEHIPVKTDTRLNDQVAVGPLAGVDVTYVAIIIIIVEGKNSVVGDQVTVIEEQTIETQTVGQLEALGHVPLVLGIDTGLVELHAGSRLGLATVTVGQANNLGGSAVDEVINTVVAVVTRTIAHVLVIGHLVLKRETTHDLVVTIVPGNVVTQVPNGVVYSVVPGKQLVTQSHVVVLVAVGIGHRDVDEGELA